MKIYSTLGIELLDLLADDKSYRYKVIMGENTLNLYFNMPEFHEIPDGSYCDFKNERYFLLKPENFKQNHSRDYEYTLTLDSFQALTQGIKFKFFTMNAGVVDSPFELKFSLTKTPSEFAQLVCDNMNVAEGSTEWIVGECIESDPVCLDFNHAYCSDAVQQIADAFNTEWEWENKKLYLRKVEKMKDSPIALKYGKNCGLLPGTTRASVNTDKVINRVFIEGSDKNIDSSVYGASTLHMPKNHTINFMGIDYITDATGTYIERSALIGRVAEKSLDATKISPSRVGIVSAVAVVNAEKNLYDITDASIPGTLDYSQLIISGETMTIIFQTGQLAGKEFEVKYVHADKRFELVPTSENGLNYPDGSLVPEVGDKYAVFHCMLPSNYVTTAEMDVLNEAVKFLYENEFPKYNYTGTLDELYAKRNWLEIGGSLNCGYFVALSDDNFLTTPVAIRISAVKEYVNKPKQPELTLSNEVSGTSLNNKLKEIPAQEQAIKRVNKETERFAKRGFREAKQTTEMLQSALLNFSGSISPLTVQTMQILAGDETLQFEFVASSTSTTSVDHAESYNPATKQFSSAAGVLQHKTLGVTTLSSSHAASELKWWNMTAFVSSVLDDSSKSYFLYAKVNKTANTGVFLLSETAISLESVAGYYHLLMGILNSEYDGDRSYSQMYGYSELTPARLTTKKIVSPTGKVYFDLEKNNGEGEIGGVIKFIAPDGSLKSVSDTFTGLDTDKQNAVVNGKTIIVGGYLNTELIRTDLIVANHILTAESGERIALNINNDNALKIYDASNVMRVKLGYKNGAPAFMFYDETGAETFNLSSLGVGGSLVASEKIVLNNGAYARTIDLDYNGDLLIHGNIRATGNIFADNEVYAYGAGSGGQGSGGLIQAVYSYANLGGSFNNATLTDTFNAYTINQMNNRLIGVENGALTQISSALVTNALGFIPVKQGGGIDQTNNNVYIGCSNAGKVKVTIDSTNIGNILFEGAGNSYLLNDSNYLKYAPSPSNPQNANFAIGTYNDRNFIQSHSSLPLDLNPLGNTVTVNGQTIWHSGNFAPSNYVQRGGDYMTGRLDIYTVEALRIYADGGYLSFYNSAGTTRNGYIQFDSNSAYINAQNGSGDIGLINKNAVIIRNDVGGEARIQLTGSQGSAKQYSIKNSIYGISNTGFSIRNDSNGTTPFYIDSGDNSVFNGNVFTNNLYSSQYLSLTKDGDNDSSGNPWYGLGRRTDSLVNLNGYFGVRIKTASGYVTISTSGDLVSTGSISSSGAISSSNVGESFRVINTSSTDAYSTRYTNASGTLYVGIENSNGSYFGASSYNSVIYSPSNNLFIKTPTASFTGYLDAYNTINARKNTPVGIDYSQLGIQVYSSDGSPVGIGFHRSGYSQCILEHYNNGLTVRSDGQIGQGGLGNFNAATITGTLFNGSGSGLSNVNASYVNGLDQSNIVWGGSRGKSTNRNSGNANTSDASNASGFYFGNTVTGMPSSDWWNWITCVGNDWSGADGYGFQLANSFWGDDLRVRRMTSGTWHDWQSIYHSSNSNLLTVDWNAKNINASGEITAYSSSDERLKENIQPLNNSLDVINKLNPVQYNWNDKAKELNPNKNEKTDVGVIAQELKKVLPNLVHNIYNDEFLAVDYVKLIPYLIGAIQELTTEINTLKNK